jgi:transposase-like protein
MPPRCRPRRRNSTASSLPTVARLTALPTGSSTTSPKALAVFTLPEPHWRRMRTANPIEWAIQQEIKRRTSKVRVFPNRDALLRLVTAVLVEIDEDWATSNRIYINWDNSDA